MADAAGKTARSAWRPDDIVAYEEMRDLSVIAQTHLIARARRGGVNAATTRGEAAALRHETLIVDGFDRTAIDAHIRRVVLRLAELRAEDREHA